MSEGLDPQFTPSTDSGSSGGGNIFSTGTPSNPPPANPYQAPSGNQPASSAGGTDYNTFINNGGSPAAYYNANPNAGVGGTGPSTPLQATSYNNSYPSITPGAPSPSTDQGPPTIYNPTGPQAPGMSYPGYSNPYPGTLPNGPNALAVNAGPVTLQGATPNTVNYLSGGSPTNVSGMGGGSPTNVSGMGGGSLPNPATTPPQGLVPQAPKAPAAAGPPTPPPITGNLTQDGIAQAQFAQAYAQWVQSQQLSGGSTPPPTPTPTPGAAPPNPFPAGQNPYLPNPTGTGPNGQYGLNQTYFPTQATANTVAGLAGNGATVINNPNGLLSAPASPFTQNQPSYQVQLGNGTIMNPGNVASYYQNYSDPSQANLLARLVNGELTGTGEGNVGYNSALGPGVAIGGTPASNAASLDTNAVAATQPTVNTFTNTPITPASQQALGGGGVTPAASTPQASTQPLNANNVNPQDLTSLQNALQLLQAYQGLGSGGGNPTSVNTNGQLGSMIAALLSGIVGGQSLYSRQRQYPSTP